MKTKNEYLAQYKGLSKEVIAEMDRVYNNPTFSSNNLSSLENGYSGIVVDCVLSSPDKPVYKRDESADKKAFEGVFYLVTFEDGKKVSMLSSIFPENPRLESPIGMLFTKTSNWTGIFQGDKVAA